MKNTKSILSGTIIILFLASSMRAQEIDQTQLSLEISKAYAANYEQLKQHVWQRKTEVYSEGKLALTVISDVSFDATGKLQQKVIDSKSAEVQGGPMKKNAAKNRAEEMKDYWMNAVGLLTNYIFMSKGDLVDFFDKARLAETEDEISAVADNVRVAKDHAELRVDKNSLFYKRQTIRTFMDADQVNCDVTYTKLSNDLNVVDVITVDMPAQKLKVVATNYDYAKKL